jgi:hypothetical protein
MANVVRPELGAQISFPHKLAVHIERHNLAGAEPGINALAIRNGAGGRKVVLFMDNRQVAFGHSHVFPEFPPAGAIKRRHNKRDRGVRVGGCAVAQWSLAGGRGVALLI